METNRDVILQAENIRRGIASAWVAVAAFLFCFLSILEVQAEEPVFAVITGVAAVSCGVMALLTYRLGVRMWPLRLTIGSILAVVFLEASRQQFIHLVFVSAVSPLLFILMWNRYEATAWTLVTGFLGMLVLSLHDVVMSIQLSPFTLFMSVFGVLAVALCFERMWAGLLRSTGGERQRLEEEIAEKNAIAARNDQLFSDLNSALREVRELTGLIPICASCKKIRGDEDFWEHVEAYLHKRTRLQFSHGLCPDCSTEAMDDISQHEVTARGQ